jgi:hypothetical protein
MRLAWRRRVSASQDDGIAALRAGLDAAMTVEAACVTLLGVARQEAVNGTVELGPETVRFLRDTQCADEAHYHFLESIGATPSALAFAMPPAALADEVGLLEALIELNAISVAAYMAAARQFAEFGGPRLVEIAYQMGAVDAQHEALARFLLGDRPVSNRAFARWRFVDLTEAAAALTATGVLDDASDTVAIFGLVPATTDDALRPEPPVGTPFDPAATPVP